MDEITKSVVDSLDGQDEALLPYLPYLLQDLWEIGASPEAIIALLKKHQIHQQSQCSIIDLGCGKGAISIRLAKEFGWRIHGIDAMPEFIEEAEMRAKKYEAEHLCRFEVGDIRQRVDTLRDYDLVILGSIGPVFGNMTSTLANVVPCVKPGGYIILDDGYLRDDSELQSTIYRKRSDVLTQIQRSPVTIIDEYFFDDNFIEESDQEIFAHIKRRAGELSEQFPENVSLFEGYVEAQERENEILEHHVVCMMWLLKTAK